MTDFGKVPLADGAVRSSYPADMHHYHMLDRISEASGELAIPSLGS